MKRAYILLLGGLLLLLVGVSSLTQPSGTTFAATPDATQAATLAATKAPTLPPLTEPLGKPPVFLAKFYQAWVGSAHANKDSEVFNHWNKEGMVPAGCANCHSTPGYVDYLGDDGTTVGKVDKDSPIGSVINCDACHSAGAAKLTTVAFPSGVAVSGMGDSTRCIVCHQGRASTVQVKAAVEKAGLKDSPDKVEPKLSFINVHYFAAAATLYGTEVKGGYEFDGKVYNGRNGHVDGYNTCAGCHDPHTLKVKVQDCATCHKDVKTEEDLLKIRMNGSLADFNGNGDVKEGIAAEIKGLQEQLMKAMQTYATKISGKSIVYDPATYPYFFIDTNADGKSDKEELVAANAFKLFTPRLLEAAYNYQVSVKDPGNFAHNPKYTIELLYDSIDALATGLGGTGIDMGKLERTAPAHFNAASEPFRHWDKDGIVPGSCAKCHTDSGLATFLVNSTNIAVKPSQSFKCTTCHDNIPKFSVYAVEKVTFPSGASVSLGRKNSDNLCLNCHQGRESTVSVNKAIAASGAKDDQVSDKLAFRNVHYFAAGASLFGGDVQGAYQYADKKYNGQYQHKSPYNSCSKCHDTHSLKLQFGECTTCHEKATKPQDIRDDSDDVDYNGNSDVKEPIAAEIKSFQDELMKQISKYATDKAGAAIVYSSAAYPYYFVDKNGNGKADPEELTSDNGYKSWTPNLLRAAYNYQFFIKDPGAFAHNPSYTLQVLYDSIESLGGKAAVAKLTRPEVKAAQ